MIRRLIKTGGFLILFLAGMTNSQVLSDKELNRLNHELSVIRKLDEATMLSIIPCKEIMAFGDKKTNFVIFIAGFLKHVDVIDQFIFQSPMEKEHMQPLLKNLSVYIKKQRQLCIDNGGNASFYSIAKRGSAYKYF